MNNQHAISSRPVFSVIVPCRNGAETLKQTVASVKRQTLRHWELIIVDDGSTDETLEIAKQVATDPRVRIVCGQFDGPSPARNVGASAALGRYLMFLDADDLLRESALFTLSQAFDSQAQAMVLFGKVDFITADGEPTNRQSSVPAGPLAPRDLLFGNPACTASNIAVRRSAFRESGGFNPAFAHAEDQEWLLRMTLKYPGGIVGLPEPMVRYRTGRASQSAGLAKMDRGWSGVIEKAAELRPDIVARYGNRAHAARLRHLASRLAETGERTAALRTLFTALKRYPPLALIEPRRTAGALARIFKAGEPAIAMEA